MSSDQQMSYVWNRHPQAYEWLQSRVRQIRDENTFIESFEQRLLEQTATRLFDWVDHIALPYNEELDKTLIELGFVQQVTTARYRLFAHPGAHLPRIAAYDDLYRSPAIALRVDSIGFFLMVHGLSAHVEGSPYAPFCRCCISHKENGSLWIVERRSQLPVDPVECSDDYPMKYLEAQLLWQSRPRHLTDEQGMLQHTLTLIERLCSLVGVNTAAWVVLQVERDYWQSRNKAAQLQKNRQDSLGMGWGNQDHHTFRSSRRHFSLLVRLFEMLGFHCRERFYAGEEAGWGAQVMEHERCPLVLFLDVDLSPEEVAIDFAHQQLPERNTLGTIGLWCALHGDSILQAGMHHLEGQFAFDLLKHQLNELGVGMMNPFSDLSYLKQAFTQGERWRVEPSRIQDLLAKGLIDEKLSDLFLKEGAIGSHLENLQRDDGYKGFNQKNVSYIIKKTDPRLGC